MARKKEGARMLGPYVDGKGWRVIEFDEAGRRTSHYSASLAEAERLVLTKPLPASARTPLTEGRKIELLDRARSPGIAGLNDKLADAAPHARVCLAALVELLSRDESLRAALYAAVRRSASFLFWPRLIPRPVLVQDASSLPKLEPARSASLAVLTERQRIVFDFITKGIEKGRVPTLREIGDYIGIRSIANIKYYIKILKEKGCLNMAEAVPLIQGVSYYRRRHLGHENVSPNAAFARTKEALRTMTPEQFRTSATAAGIYTKDGQPTKPYRASVAKSKNKANPRVSARSIAAELISIFEKGPENEYQGEDDPSNSRDGAEVVRGAGQEQAD